MFLLHNCLENPAEAAKQDHVYVTVNKHMTAQNCLDTLHLLLLQDDNLINPPEAASSKAYNTD